MIDSNSPISLYHQLKETLIQKIITKEWPPESKIPTEKELGCLFNVSRTTVRYALREMENENYIFRRAGSGTFVKASMLDQKVSRFYSFSEEFQKKGYEHKTKLLGFNIISGNHNVCSNLELASNELVIEVRRLRIVDDYPYAIETSYLPYKLFPSLTVEAIEINGLYNSMRMLGVFPDKATESISALLLSGDDAILLQADDISAALKITRKTQSKNAFVEYCICVIKGDRFTFSVDLL